MDYVIKRSERRTKTIQARVADGKVEFLVPANASDEELEPIISKMMLKMEKRIETRNNSEKGRSDSVLEERAQQLNNLYFGGRLTWNSIKYSPRQEKRRGSCTTAARTIRISERLKEMPRWVEDYVIVHELSHLIEPNHSERFWSLVHRYPLTERARGFLMAMDLVASKNQGS
jgi:predicted metal-dependent hydrolase